MALFESADIHISPYALELQALEDYRSFSATTIQRFYRGWICRMRLKRQRTAEKQRQQAEESAATTAQQLYKAAHTIQDAWRSFNNKRIYRYYRDLIRFREAGDPRQMLRCVNAREAALIDAAAGLHVRFRLGGSSFPPLIFYKIFTHRPVTDIGAFGPRDYASEAAATAAVDTAALVHNKPEAAAPGASSSSRMQQPASNHSRGLRCSQQQQDFELPSRLREYVRPDGSVGHRSRWGWYRREDRNGWRPVAERLLLDPEQQSTLPALPGMSSSGGRSSSRHKHRTRRLRQRHAYSAHGSSSDGCSRVTGTGQQGHGQQETGCAAGVDGSSSGCEASSSGRSSPEFYHYSPIVRREECTRKLKQRRRHWLLKMYRAGMQGSSTGPNDSANSRDSSSSSLEADASGRPPPPPAAANASSGPRHRSSGAGNEEQLLQQLELELLSKSTAGCSSSSDDDWQVDDLVALGLDSGLLAWSQKLDFDNYLQHWHSTAVTLGSEVLLPESEQALVTQLKMQLQSA